MPFFESLVLILFCLILLLLAKMINIENQRYQEIKKDLQFLTQILETLQQRLNKLNQPTISPPLAAPEVTNPNQLTTQLPPTIPSLSSVFLSARNILKILWNWIIVGEEYRAKNISMEYAIATTWLLRFGVVAILFAIGYFLNYSITKGYLVPTARILITLLAGFSMLIGGLKLLRSQYQLIGQGLMGGGLAILYFSLYAATFMYQLISLSQAFTAMVAVTITASFLAIQIDSLLLAIFSIIGGYATPLMLWSGPPKIILLYSYLLLLGLGIFGISHYKQWRLLNYLAFVFNYTIFIASLWNYQAHNFLIILSFLTSFFILHSSLVYIYNIAKGEKSTFLEIAQLLINAVIYTLLAYKLIIDAHGYPAVLSFSLALFYAIHAYLFLKHRPIDRGLIISLIALAGFYMIWSMPLLFEKETLTISWSLQAFLFLWVGFKLRSNFVKNLAYLIYLTICLRLLYFDIPRHFDLKPEIINIHYYLSTLVERLWTFGMAITSIIGAFFLLNQPIQAFKTLQMDPRNDTPHLVATIEAAFYWLGLLFLFLYLNLEFNTLFSYYEPLRLPMLTLLWSGLVVYFLNHYLLTHHALILKALWIFLSVTVAKIFILDIPSWQISRQFIFNIDYNILNVFIRLFDFGVIIAVIYACWQLLHKKSLGFLGLGLFFVYASLECHNFLYWQIPDLQTSGISILWAIFAIGYLACGILYNIQTLRYVGLFLFLVVIGKIFLVDLAQTETFYRVVAFLLIGLILLIGSFVYIYSRPKFEKVDLNT